MRLDKTCPSCQRALSTRKVSKVGKEFFGEVKMLYVNCRACHSTLILALKKDQHSRKAA